MSFSEKTYRGGPSTVSTLDHPHAGARDAHGYWNYVPNVSLFRKTVLEQLSKTNSSNFFPLDPQILEKVCHTAPGSGEEGSEGYKLLRHIQLNGPNPLAESVGADGNDSTTTEMMPTLAPTTDISNLSPARILCAVYTHEGKNDQIRAILETWGWRCDGFFAASTKTVTSISAVDLPHRGEEKYSNMWQKTRSMLAFMFDNYVDQFDYYYLAGDDTYLIVENLRNYLRLLEAMEGGRDTRPLYIGQNVFVNVTWHIEVVYNMGGSGYLINRLALQRLVLEELPTCRAEEETSFEDVNVGRCLLQMGILPVDTADAGHRQRFFDLNPEGIARRDPDESLECVKEIYRHWKRQNHGWRHGIDSVSTQAVAFHQIRDPSSTTRHHAILYKSCQKGTVLGDAITSEDSN